MCGIGFIPNRDTKGFQLFRKCGTRSVIAGNDVSAEEGDMGKGTHADAADSGKKYSFRRTVKPCGNALRTVMCIR